MIKLYYRLIIKKYRFCIQYTLKNKGSNRGVSEQNNLVPQRTFQFLTLYCIVLPSGNGKFFLMPCEVHVFLNDFNQLKYFKSIKNSPIRCGSHYQAPFEGETSCSNTWSHGVRRRQYYFSFSFHCLRATLRNKG